MAVGYFGNDWYCYYCGKIVFFVVEQIVVTDSGFDIVVENCIVDDFHKCFISKFVDKYD
jgi:hypothetical protein